MLIARDFFSRPKKVSFFAVAWFCVNNVPAIHNHNYVFWWQHRFIPCCVGSNKKKTIFCHIFLYLFLRKYALRQKMLEKKKNVHCYVDGCEKRWQKSVSLLFKFIWVLTLFVLYFIHFNELRDFVKRTAKRILQQFLLVACLLSYIALVSTRVEIWHIIVNEQHEQIKNG